MPAPNFQEIELALTSTAIAGDAGGLYRIASNLMNEGVSFDSLLFDYLMETERAVGQRWQQGDYLVAEEHTVTAAIETVISLLTGMLDQPKDAPLVVIATAEGDDHSLPARALAAHLLFVGLRTKFVGADVPAADLGEFLESQLPVAIVLSAAMTTHLLAARSMINAAHEVGVPVLVGGKAFGSSGEWAQVVGADAWVPTLKDAEPLIEGWIDAAPNLRNPEDLSPDLEELIDNRSAIATHAERALGQDFPPRLRDEVRLLLSAVEAAVLTGDDQVIVEMLAWQELSLAAHHMDSSNVTRAVSESLQDSEVGRDALARAMTHRTS